MKMHTVPRRAMRSAPALRTTTSSLMLPLLLLLVMSCTHGASAQLLTVRILNYLSYGNAIFASFPAGRVDFSNSLYHCENNGAILTADQTPAAHTEISSKMRDVLTPGVANMYIFMGGDMMYTVSREPDLSKRCRRTLPFASINCIYQWNRGAFADSPQLGSGVSFYRGSLYNLTGVGPMNGYQPFWPGMFPAMGEAYVLNKMVSASAAQATWYDFYGLSNAVLEPHPAQVVIVCEVQAPDAVNTTTVPPTVRPSWAAEHWYVPLIAVVAAVIASVVAILFFCGCFAACCGGNNAEKNLTTMVLRERGNYGLYRYEKGGGQGNSMYGGPHNLHDFVPFESPAPVNVFGSAPQNTYGFNDVTPFSRAQAPLAEKAKPAPVAAAPVEDANSVPVSKPRQRSFRRQRGSKQSGVTMTEVDVPNAEEIADGDNANLAQTTSTHRRRSSTNMEALDI